MRLARLLPLLLLLLLTVPTVSAGPASTVEVVRQAAAHWLERHYALPGSRVQAEAGPLDSRLRIAACPVALQVSLPGDDRPRPRMSVQVRCPAPGGWALRVPVELHVYRRVLVADHALMRGNGIRAADVHAEERDLTRLGYGYIESMDQVAERTLARSLRAGAVLTPSALGGRRMVRAGDHVQLVAELDGIAVRAEGVALGGGDSGARLRVRNRNSGRVVDAVVRAPGVVVALP